MALYLDFFFFIFNGTRFLKNKDLNYKMQDGLRKEEKSAERKEHLSSHVLRQRGKQYQPFKKLMHLNFCLTKGVVSLD